MKLKGMLKLKLTSGIFHVTQPDMNWVDESRVNRNWPAINWTAEHIRNLEESEKAWYRDNENREVEITWDMDQVRRGLSTWWLTAFDQCLRQRLEEEHLDTCEDPVPTIITEFTGVYVPKSYDAGGDECKFVLTLPRATWNRICFFCFYERAGEFGKYLADYHSSRTGFVSYIENRVDWHRERYQRFRDGEKLSDAGSFHKDTHLFWVTLDFFLFIARGRVNRYLSWDDDKERDMNAKRFTQAFERYVVEDREDELRDAMMVRDAGEVSAS